MFHFKNQENFQNNFSLWCNHRAKKRHLIIKFQIKWFDNNNAKMMFSLSFLFIFRTLPLSSIK